MDESLNDSISFLFPVMDKVQNKSSCFNLVVGVKRNQVFFYNVGFGLTNVILIEQVLYVLPTVLFYGSCEMFVSVITTAIVPSSFRVFSGLGSVFLEPFLRLGSPNARLQYM